MANNKDKLWELYKAIIPAYCGPSNNGWGITPAGLTRAYEDAYDALVHWEDLEETQTFHQSRTSYDK